MIPIALITGFLGSGKTTFLKHLVKRYRERKLVYLVNEFSLKDVDGAILSPETPDLVSIAGGSIFCRCLVTEFIQRMTELPARFGTADRPVQGVVVEASGIANPKVASQMLREAKLNDQYELATITAVVDPGSFLKLLHTLPNIRAQIQAAHFILINKTDLYPPELVDQTEAAVREIKPEAAITRTVHCATDLELFGLQDSTVPGEYATCANPQFVNFTVPLHQELDLGRFRNALQPLKEEIYRIKGFVLFGGVRFLVDYSASGLAMEETAIEQPAALVFIVRGPVSEPVRQLLHDTRSGKFALRAG